MNFWNESSTTIKVLLVVGTVAVIALLAVLIVNISGSDRTAPAPEPPAGAIPTFTSTPEAVQLPSGPVLVAQTAINVRLGPSTDYPEIGALQEGETAPVIGRNETSTWYAIRFPSDIGDQGWVAAENVVAANVEAVPVLAAPQLPGAVATPTPVAEAPQAPTALIEAPAEGQVGIAVSFSAAQSTGNTALTQYAWAFGDGSVADAVVVEKSYDAAGVYLVNLVVVDSDGNEGVAQHQISIVAAAEATPPESGDQIEVPDSLIVVSVDGTPATVTIVGGIPSFEARIGQTVKLDASAARDLYPTLQVIWDMGDGTTEVAGIVVEHVYAAGGNYQIVIAFTDGQQSGTKLWQVNVVE